MDIHLERINIFTLFTLPFQECGMVFHLSRPVFFLLFKFCDSIYFIVLIYFTVKLFLYVLVCIFSSTVFLLLKLFPLYIFKRWFSGFQKICTHHHCSAVSLVAVDFRFVLLGFLSRCDDNPVTSSSYFISRCNALARLHKGVEEWR